MISYSMEMVQGENGDKDTEDLKEEIRTLKSEVRQLEGMLESLMDMHKNVLEKVSVTEDIDDRYKKMLSLYNRFGHISPGVLSEVDDPVSEKIIVILFETSPLNITQISEKLREKTGKSSRHTVRDRLERLKEKDVVKKVEKGKGKNYALTEKMINKWAEMLGIKK